MKSRLDKVLADNGFGSRRDIKRLLRERTLTVNGVPCRDPATRVDPERDDFVFDGQPLALRVGAYLMLNKPAGVITSTADPNHDTVLSLLRPPFSGMSLFPVGRLDVDTEGLLILTNDGILCHRLTSPRTGTDKTYLARLRDPLDEAAFADYRARLSTGVTLGDGMLCQPARLSRADSTVSGDSSLGDAAGAGSLVLLTIQEGKYHQVKRMFKMLGNEVVYLRRVAMGDLALDPALAPGEYRELTPEEVAGLRAACGLTERGQIDGIDDEGESDDGL